MRLGVDNSAAPDREAHEKREDDRHVELRFDEAAVAGLVPVEPVAGPELAPETSAGRRTGGATAGRSGSPRIPSSSVARTPRRCAKPCKRRGPLARNSAVLAEGAHRRSDVARRCVRYLWSRVRSTAWVTSDAGPEDFEQELRELIGRRIEPVRYVELAYDTDAPAWHAYGFNCLD